MSNILEDLMKEFSNKKGGMFTVGESDKNLGASLKSTLSRLQEIKKDLNEMNKELNDDGPCFCKDCLTFETFEDLLQDYKGKIDYTSFSVGGKVFKVKYWSNGVLNHIAVRPVEVIEKQELQDLKDQELQDLRDQKIKLTDLVRDYTEAGEFISAQRTITDLLEVSNRVIIMENSNNSFNNN